ncbi:hypothetical protein [Pectobacterium punjabense]|uniref:hypothetical protein n=1 Tax=Pectobacterium punjabense TaxID=2108399 RepID=UPI002404F0DD|nr:hypothetical protein [Pectobacterium punjabense]MDG0795628.1 hypothetical protein [Pectobacterium punjabense]
MSLFNNGTKITIKTFDNYYLSTSNGQVSLIPETSNPRPEEIIWTVSANITDSAIPQAIYNLSQPDANGNNVYLDGLTGSGAVHLTNSIASPYTGAYWAISPVGEGGAGGILLLCQGNVSGFQLLNGGGATGTISLVSSVSPTGSSTIFNFEVVN